MHWGVDDWQNVADVETRDTGLGLHIAEFDAAMLAHVHAIDFTFQWRGNGTWAGEDFHVAIAG